MLTDFYRTNKAEWDRNGEKSGAMVKVQPRADKVKKH